MKFSITWEERGLYARFTGTITRYDLVGAQQAFQGSERFDNCDYAVWDFLDCDASGIEREGLDLLLANHLGATVTRKYLRGAFVSRQQNLVSVMGQLVAEAKSLGSTWDFGTFDTREDAIAWAREQLSG